MKMGRRCARHSSALGLAPKSVSIYLLEVRLIHHHKTLAKNRYVNVSTHGRRRSPLDNLYLLHDLLSLERQAARHKFGIDYCLIFSPLQNLDQALASPSCRSVHHQAWWVSPTRATRPVEACPAAPIRAYRAMFPLARPP
jgi:hypothetical protein